MSDPVLDRDFVSAVQADPGRALLAFDFDGTLAPIVDDPEQAHIHPEAVQALDRLGPLVGTVAVITGRPARTAVRLGTLDSRDGLGAMVVLGQYGAERWDAAEDSFQVPPPPDGIAEVEQGLDELLTTMAEAGEPVDGVTIEHKGRALGVHTRRAGDADAAFERLLQPVTDLAERHGLVVEPGRHVIEVRPDGHDKGATLRDLVAERGARTVLFCGDDLGDLPAFAAGHELRDEGLTVHLVVSASSEQDALTARADTVVDGPDGLARWLTALADRLARPS